MTITRINPESPTRSGRETFGSIAAGGYGDVPVTFSPAMPSVPNITATRADVGGTGYNLQLGTRGVTKNGFTLRCWNFGSAAVTPSVSWIAVC